MSEELFNKLGLNKSKRTKNEVLDSIAARYQRLKEQGNNQDIDEAIAQVMYGLEQIEKIQEVDKLDLNPTVHVQNRDKAINTARYCIKAIVEQYLNVMY